MPWLRGRSKQTVRTTAAVAAVWAAVAENPRIRQLARYHRMDPRTMTNLDRENLALESLVVIQRLLLT
jgi:hypothetical protein